MINKTFSKGDLLDIISNFGIDIPNANNVDKLKLSILLSNELDNISSIEPDNEIYMINNISELKQYLEKSNPEKVLTVKQKQSVMKFCREVIIYCNNGYNLDSSSFNSREEIYIPMNDIAIHGNIPSVRRAIELLNKDTNMKDKIKPIISKKMIKQIEKKKKTKVKNYYGLIIKKGQFQIDFN
jgi:hypothetical protein